MLKSIGIVLGSYILSIILVLCTDPILTRIFPGDFERGHVPSNPALIASTACFVVVSIFCAWVCARFAPRNPAKHVLWFFALGEAMGLGFTIPNWSKGWPNWYWISWLLAWPTSAWIGLKLARRTSSSETAPAAMSA